MKKLLLAAVAVSLSSCCVALAQAPAGLGWRAPAAPSVPSPIDSPEPPQPEIEPNLPPHAWYYLQEQKRWDDPRLAVRRKAEFRAAQRQKRLASMRWFGYSKARPIASTTPVMDHYSPFWSGNSNHPFIWIGEGWPTTAWRTSPIVEYR